MPNLLWRTHPRKYGKDSRESADNVLAKWVSFVNMT